MIDINPADVIAEARDDTGRFIIFSRADLPACFPLPWWAVCLDTGGDGLGILVRPTTADAGDGWTAAELLHVALARADAEFVAGFQDGTCPGFLSLALRAHGGSAVSEVTFTEGAQPSPFPWCVSSVRGHALPFTPEAGGDPEGVTLAQIVIVLDRLHRDWPDAPAVARHNLAAAVRACGGAVRWAWAWARR